MRRSFLTIALAAFAGLAMLQGPVAQAQSRTGGTFNGVYAGQGLKGYDPVAYFTDGKPVKGSDKFTADYGGVKWFFASAKNRDAFVADPAKYAPQYGGFCAWGVAEKKALFDVDPVNGWTIHDGKLYVNFNSDINNVFRKDPAGYVAKAQPNWSELNR